MNAPHKRRVSTGSALVAAVLVIGVAGIVYSRVEQAATRHRLRAPPWPVMPRQP